MCSLGKEAGKPWREGGMVCSVPKSLQYLLDYSCSAKMHERSTAIVNSLHRRPPVF